MKKVISVYLLLFISMALVAQNEPVLTVLGQAKMKVIPDVTTINIALTSVHQEYSQSVQNLEQKASELKKFLETKGIDEKYVDSENFKVDKQYDFVNGERKYIGFNAKLWIQLKFENDNALVNEIINAIGESNTESEISIDYEISLAKQDSVNTELIKSAIDDAKKKATLIAESTGQELVKIAKITYGVRENLNVDPPVKGLMIQETMAAGVQKKSFTITPKEMLQSTHIIIYWILGQNDS
jgi:hypothetical protein